MGRAASHVTLECALQTHPQLALICEEVAAHRWGLKDVVRQVADMVVQRAELGKDFGVVLIPEGLVEFLHDVSDLILGAARGRRRRPGRRQQQGRGSRACWSQAARPPASASPTPARPPSVGCLAASGVCRAERADGTGREPA